MLLSLSQCTVRTMEGKKKSVDWNWIFCSFIHSLSASPSDCVEPSTKPPDSDPLQLFLRLRSLLVTNADKDVLSDTSSFRRFKNDSRVIWRISLKPLFSCSSWNILSCSLQPCCSSISMAFLITAAISVIWSTCACNSWKKRMRVRNQWNTLLLDPFYKILSATYMSIIFFFCSFWM